MLELKLGDFATEEKTITDTWANLEANLEGRLEPGSIKVRVRRVREVTQLSVQPQSKDCHVVYEVGLGSAPGIVRQRIDPQLALKLLNKDMVGRQETDKRVYFFVNLAGVYGAVTVHYG